MKKIVIVTMIFFGAVLSFSGKTWGNTENVNKHAVGKSGDISEEYIVTRLKTLFSRDRLRSKTKSYAETRPTREVTILLKEAVQRYDDFSAESKAYIDAFLKRPDNTSNTWPWSSDKFYLPEPVETFEPDAGTYPSIGGKFKFWYVTHDTPDSSGNSHQTTLAYVQSMAQAFDTVYATTITTLGYPEPPDDSGDQDNGGDGKMDIYILNCGAYEVYGYTALDSDAGATSSYMVMDNDYVEFLVYNNSEEEAMKVTAAHEYHHAVQFGINSYADGWIMEATSTWIEDQVYDDINDNLQYLNHPENGFFANPHQSLDSEFQWYNSWIWLEYMETKWGQASVKRIWVEYLASTNDGVSAVMSVLNDNNTPLKNAFTEFAQVNYTKEGFYTSHLLYDGVFIENDVSGIGRGLDYSTESSDTFDSQTFAVNHLAANYFKLTPGASIGAGDDDTLTVHINGLDNRSINVVVVVKDADDLYSEYDVTLDSSNDGTVEILNFNTTALKEAVFVLINYSTDQENSTFIISGGLGENGASNTNPGGSDTSNTTVIGGGSSSSSGCFVGSLY